MTAGTIELMPCRVPPMGLGAPPPTTIPASPSLKSKQRIRCNLFGSAEPGEAETLRRNEEQRQWQHFEMRYILDLNVDRQAFTTPVTMTSTTENVTAPAKASTAHALPILIELEIKEHQERQQRERERLALSEEEGVEESLVEKCNSKIENMQAIAETTPQQKNKCNPNSVTSTTDTSAVDQSSKSCGPQQSSSDHHNHQNSVNVRTKPFARQRLLTESYTVRKPKQNLKRKPVVTKTLKGAQKLWPELWQKSESMDLIQHNHHHHHQHHKEPQQQQEHLITSSTQITTTSTELISSNNSNKSNNSTLTKT